MSSASLEQELIQDAIYFQRFDYICASTLTLAVYDYLINLGGELEFIWGNRFTWTTLVYVMMRYLGLIFIALHNIPDFGLSLSGNTCFHIYVISQVCIFVVILLLQGIMSLRVYVLFGRSRSILLVLGPCFFVTQVLSIVPDMWYLTAGGSYWIDEHFLNIYACAYNAPTNRTWITPISNAAVLAFEVLLCAFALRYAIKNIPVSFLRSPGRGATSLAWVIVRDNLTYFFIALVSMFLASIDQVPSFVNSSTFLVVYSVALTVLTTMAGPRMVINLRRCYSVALGAGTAGSNEMMTTVSFASAPPQAEYEID